MAEKLHRLSGGTWLKLSEVTRVNVYTDRYNSGCGIGVAVTCGQTHLYLPFDNEADAQIYADELAGFVNAQANADELADGVESGDLDANGTPIPYTRYP